MVTTWMSDLQVLGFVHAPRFPWTQMLCRLYKSPSDKRSPKLTNKQKRPQTHIKDPIVLSEFSRLWKTQKSTSTCTKNVGVSKLLKWDTIHKRKTTPTFKGWGRYSQTWALKTPPFSPSVFKHPQRLYRPQSCTLKTVLGYCATSLVGELFGCLGDLKHSHRELEFPPKGQTTRRRKFHHTLSSFANVASIHWRVRDSHAVNLTLIATVTRPVVITASVLIFLRSSAT